MSVKDDDTGADRAVMLVDTIAPQVVRVAISDIPETSLDEFEFNLLNPKPLTDGPTPVAHSLDVVFTDGPDRRMSMDMLYLGSSNGNAIALDERDESFYRLSTDERWLFNQISPKMLDIRPVAFDAFDQSADDVITRAMVYYAPMLSFLVADENRGFGLSTLGTVPPP